MVGEIGHIVERPAGDLLPRAGARAAPVDPGLPKAAQMISVEVRSGSWNRSPTVTEPRVVCDGLVS